jgi:hypothetical protein
MAIAHVQHVSSQGSGSSATLNITVTAGNTLILIIAAHNSNGDDIVPTSISDGHNTYGTPNHRYYNSSLNGTCGVTISSVTGGALTITMNWPSSTDYAVAAFEYSGINPSGFDGFSAGDDGSGSSSDDTTFFLFMANSIYLGWTTCDASNTFTQTSAYTERLNLSGFISLAVVEKIGHTGGNQGTWSMSTTANWAGIGLGYAPFVPPASKPCLFIMDTCI